MGSKSTLVEYGRRAIIRMYEIDEVLFAGFLCVTVYFFAGRSCHRGILKSLSERRRTAVHESRHVDVASPEIN